MKKIFNSRHTIMTVSFILFISSFLPSHTALANHQSNQLSQKEVQYILEFHGPPLIEFPTSNIPENNSKMQSLIRHQHTLFLQECFKRNPIHLSLEFEYFHVLNGMAIRTSPETIQEIQNSPYVKTIYLAQEYYLQRETSVPSTGASFCWEQKDSTGEYYKGQGVLVGVIDTGVDYWHGELGGGLGKTWNDQWYKVRYGYDFSEMKSIPYSIGLSNHGTHVAGIIAGNGENGIAIGKNNASGVAPRASLCVYKVFTNQKNSTGEAALLMALEQAISDGCDVVNLSLGKNYGWTNDPLSLACDRVSEAGILVVASAGNSGNRNQHYNRFPVHAPGSSIPSLSVAASDATPKDGFYFQISNQTRRFAIGKKFDSTPNASSENTELVFVDETELSSLKQSHYQGKAIIVFQSTLSLTDIITTTSNSGIHSLIVVHTKDYPSTEKISTTLQPVMSVAKTTGTFLRSLVEDSKEMLEIQYAYEEPVHTMASFSSEGPTPDLILKPEITAPGVRINSTLTNHQFGTMSGTSMSSPHVAGGAALLIQKHPDWKPAEIKSCLINYSTPIVNPLTGELYSIYQQGGGEMNLKNSFSASILMDPPTLSFGAVEKNTRKSFTLTNKGASLQSIEILCSSPQKLNVSVVVSPYRVSVKPNESITIEITLEIQEDTMDGFCEFWIEGRDVSETVFQIPCIFHHGSLETMDAILHSYMFPNLACSPNSDGYGDETNYVCLSPYNIDGIEMDLFDKDDKFIQNLFYHRGTIGAGYYSVPFFGKHNGAPLPDGLYSIKSYALPTGKNYEKVTNWEFGKESKVLIDTKPPNLSLEAQWLQNDTIKITGRIQDENSDFGMFLYYELDYDDGSILSLNEDGSFDHTIQILQEHCFIRFTAQDLAGNRTSIKKRIPNASFSMVVTFPISHIINLAL
ncbi:MAG TPA: S8 family serine peptidase [Caldisericia bacterium]|nr:S8 family serine peptidase [Caldisericia bacterium]